MIAHAIGLQAPSQPVSTRISTGTVTVTVTAQHSTVTVTAQSQHSHSTVSTRISTGTEKNTAHGACGGGIERNRCEILSHLPEV